MLVQTILHAQINSSAVKPKTQGRLAEIELKQVIIIRLQPSKCDSSPSEDITILKSLKQFIFFQPSCILRGRHLVVYYKITSELGISGVLLVWKPNGGLAFQNFPATEVDCIGFEHVETEWTNKSLEFAGVLYKSTKKY